MRLEKTERMESVFAHFHARQAKKRWGRSGLFCAGCCYLCPYDVLLVWVDDFRNTEGGSLLDLFLSSDLFVENIFLFLLVGVGRFGGVLRFLLLIRFRRPVAHTISFWLRVDPRKDANSEGKTILRLLSGKRRQL